MPVEPPLISIIIPCFNYERYVAEAIESALSQDYPRKEIVVVDDGSTDGSWSVITGFGDRITPVRHSNRGALASSLAGFSRSSGDFVYFLDADDALKPGALARIAPHLRPEVSKIQFMLAPIDAEGNAMGEGFPRLDPAKNSADLRASIAARGHYETPPTSGNIYRRDLYEDLGDLSYERAIDGVPYLLAPFVGEVVSVAEELGRYRIHDSNLSAFSSLSPDRMNGYARRFSGRLKHLRELLTRRGIAHDLDAGVDYSYELEMRMMASVLDGRRPCSALVRQYTRAVDRELGGRLKYSHTFFARALRYLPVPAARELIHLRINQSRFPKIRRMLKAAIR